MLYVFTIYLPEKSYCHRKISTKNQFYRQAMRPRAHFMVSFDNIKKTEELYMSLQNIYELNVIQRVTKTLVQVGHQVHGPISGILR